MSNKFNLEEYLTKKRRLKNRLLFESAGGMDYNEGEYPMEGEEEKPLFDITQYESIEELVKDIEEKANEAALKEKMDKTKRACEALESKCNELEEGESAQYINTDKVKKMREGAKRLREMHEKYLKQYEQKYQANHEPPTSKKQKKSKNKK